MRHLICIICKNINSVALLCDRLMSSNSQTSVILVRIKIVGDYALPSRVPFGHSGLIITEMKRMEESHKSNTASLVLLPLGEGQGFWAWCFGGERGSCPQWCWQMLLQIFQRQGMRKETYQSEKSYIIIYLFRTHTKNGPWYIQDNYKMYTFF